MSLIELIDPGFIRDNIAAIKSQTDKLTFDASNRLAIQNPPNLDITMLGLLKRIFGTTKEREDPYDIYDTSTKTVTSTSWTTIAEYIFNPRFSPVKSYTYYLIAGIRGYVDTPGQTLYVKVRDTRTNITSDVFTITSTSPTWIWPSYTTTGALNEVYTVQVDAYVTGGIGYITTIWLYVHEAPNILAIKSTGPGYRLTPLYATNNNNLRIALSEDTIGIARDSTLTDIKNRIDVALTTLARLQRWGRDVTPAWVHGSEVTAPAANTALVSRVVPTGKVGYIYGFFISAGEPNDFRINWTSGGTTYSIRIPFGGKGAVHYTDFIPLNEGLPADAGSTISITNVNAGGSGVIYQARLLYAEL